MADPRVVTGFRPAIKELVYPIVVERSQGARVWDIDGNEYVDSLNGFGLNLFGWQPEFVTEALEEQLDRGYEIGPQHPLPAEVARLICELTGFDRAAFCNTGSEAVMGAMRIARTVTGRNQDRDLHRLLPRHLRRGHRARHEEAARDPGGARHHAADVGERAGARLRHARVARDPASARADELAAVLVEPVQSRRPDFQPREFLRELRELTEQCGRASHLRRGRHRLPHRIRAARRGCFGIQADLATYGKVVGGGFPIGVIAGKRAVHGRARRRRTGSSATTRCRRSA